MDQSAQPRIEEFGHHRVIGLRYVGKNENSEIKALWQGPGSLIERAGELHGEPGFDGAFGICRCLPDVRDGSFEYFAAIAVTDDSPIPEGMSESFVPEGTYAIFPTTLPDLFKSWGATQAWLAANPQWEAFCDGATRCDCANHPCFELYRDDFGKTGILYLYLPIQRKQ